MNSCFFFRSTPNEYLHNVLMCLVNELLTGTSAEEIRCIFDDI